MKNTNRLLFALLAALALIFVAACSDSDADTIRYSDLYGTTWTASSGENTATITFVSGGKVEVNDSNSIFTGNIDDAAGTYNVVRSVVTIYKNGVEADSLTYSGGALYSGALTFTESSSN